MNDWIDSPEIISMMLAASVVRPGDEIMLGSTEQHPNLGIYEQFKGRCLVVTTPLPHLVDHDRFVTFTAGGSEKKCAAYKGRIVKWRRPCP